MATYHIRTFFLNHTSTTAIYTLSLHDALPISQSLVVIGGSAVGLELAQMFARLGVRVTVLEALPREHLGKRSEEHTSELQSRQYLVCRLLLQKKKRRTCMNQHPPRPRPPAQRQ